MLLDSFSQLITDKFLIALLLYWVFLVKPHRLMLVVALLLAVFIASTCLFLRPEFFMQKLDSALSWAHLLPEAANFDVPTQSMAEIHKAFVMGCYWGLASIFAFFMVYLPARRLYKYDSSPAV